MKINGFEIPEDLKYVKEHVWIKLENDRLIRIGITDYAQKMLKEITFVYLPTVGLSVTRVDAVCKIESLKALVEVYSPVTGRIVKVNEKLKEKPQLVNDDPYNEGWLVVIEPSKLKDEAKLFLTPEEYAAYIKDLVKIDENLLIYKWRRFKT